MIARLRCDATHIPLADASVHCVVTSPPYFGLRKYAGVPDVVWPDGWRGMLGNEPSPDLYVAHVVECFREVRRVLRDDGTCWIVIGDSFASSGGGRQTNDAKNAALAAENVGVSFARGDRSDLNLLGIPWRVAFALQADGWLLRTDVVWHKTSPMPESVGGWRWGRHRIKVAPAPRGATASRAIFAHKPQSDHAGKDGNGSSVFASATWIDCPGCATCTPNDGLVLRRGSWRPTRAHEFVFLLAKQPGYFCDAEAVAEPAVEPERRRADRIGGASWEGREQHSEGGLSVGQATRNPRDVWTLGPEPFAGSHFAVMPAALAERCILAGCSERCCVECGAPWAPVVEREASRTRAMLAEHGSSPSAQAHATPQALNFGAHHGDNLRVSRTLGARPTCACNAPATPGLVLDPFCGSGTVGEVAARHGRRAVLCDLSAVYLRDLADGRARGVQREMAIP